MTVPGFYSEHSTILCDGLSLASIAEAEGTPLYVYSAALIRERYREIDEALGSYPHAFALRAESELDARNRASPARLGKRGRRELRRRN